jgi:hypothetical protein
MVLTVTRAFETCCLSFDAVLVCMLYRADSLRLLRPDSFATIVAPEAGCNRLRFPRLPTDLLVGPTSLSRSSHFQLVWSNLYHEFSLSIPSNSLHCSKPTPTNLTRLSRSLRTPNPLQKPILLSKTIQRIITLGPGPNKPTQGVNLILARVTTVLVDFADRNLDTGMILGFDDAVRCAAFARDVARRTKILDEVGEGLNGGWGRGTYRSTISPFSFSMMRFLRLR